MTIIESEKTVSKVKAVFWYLRRPRLYRDLARKTISRLHHRQSVGSTRQEAEDWAEKHAMNTAEAIMLISGTAMPEFVKDLYKDVFTHAETVARELLRPALHTAGLRWCCCCRWRIAGMGAWSARINPM